VNWGGGVPTVHITTPSGTMILSVSPQLPTTPGPERHRRTVPARDRPGLGHPASNAEPDRRPGQPLTDEELDTLGALRRVGDPDGRVLEVDGHYFSCGQPMVPWLDKPLAALVAAGLITLADPDPAGSGARRARLTEAGHAHYHALRTQHLRSPAGLPDFNWLPELPGCRAAASGEIPDRPLVQSAAPDAALPAAGRSPAYPEGRTPMPRQSPRAADDQWRDAEGTPAAGW